MMAGAAAGAALAAWWPGFGIRARSALGGAALALIHPAAAAAAILIAVAWSLRHRHRSGEKWGALLLADQVALALRAGLTLEGALREATLDLSGGIAREVGSVLRAARARGLGAALAAAGGQGERVYRITERATRTGAPLGPAVEALAHELRHEDHARRMAEARRLPVRLLLPLALLILPGFVLALVGPALVSSLARLEIGW